MDMYMWTSYNIYIYICLHIRVCNIILCDYICNSMMFYVSMRGREKTSQHKHRHETTWSHLRLPLSSIFMSRWLLLLQRGQRKWHYHGRNKHEITPWISLVAEILWHCPALPPKYRYSSRITWTKKQLPEPNKTRTQYQHNHSYRRGVCITVYHAILYRIDYAEGDFGEYVMTFWVQGVERNWYSYIYIMI